ncbi:MAG: GatB/YqeY domain-containing protein [Patescibacteria group bacterium]
MDVLTQLEQDFNQAFKAKNELVVLVLRQLKSAVTNAEIAKNRQKLTEPEVIKLLRSEIKKRKDAIALYVQGGRQELADKESKEIEIISKYLPAEIEPEVIRQKIAEIIKKVGALGPQDTGKVMGLVMKELAGQADGNVVSQLVKEELSSKK